MSTLAPTPEAVLGRRQLYMLPTSYGLLFSSVLLVVLLAAVNYSNALAYALAFLLAAIGIVSMLYTHRNLLGLQVSPGPCVPVFAGDLASFPVCIKNNGALTRWGVCLEHGKREVACVDVGEGEQVSVRVQLASTHRGYLAPPPIRLSTRFPLGFLYAWSRRLQLAQHCLVYPQPAADAVPPTAGADRAGRDRSRILEGDDFLGLREFRRGDSPRNVAWKAFARGRGMLSKQFGGGYHTSVWLDWDDLPGVDPEQRLSQLCRWVLQCEQAELQYGLCMPGKTIAPAGGDEHRHRCLAALALYGS